MRSQPQPAAKPTLSSPQRYALWELLAQSERVDHVARNTWRALERRGWIDGVVVTPAGLAAMGLPLRRPRSLKIAIRAACRALPWGDGALTPQFGKAQASVIVDDPDDANGYLSFGSHPDCIGTVDIEAECDFEDLHPKSCAENVWDGVAAWLESHGYGVTSEAHGGRSAGVRWIYQDVDAGLSPAVQAERARIAIEAVRRKHE